MAAVPPPPPSVPTPLPRGRRLLRRAFAAVCWLAPLAFAGLCVLLRWADLWWPATFLMFSPRLLLGLPLPVLALAAVLAGRPLLLVPLAAAALLVAGPLSGGRLNGSLFAEPPVVGSLHIRVMTCNMHYQRLGSAPLDDLVRQVQPDVVALQEWDEENHSAVLAAPQWHTSRMHRLFLASRFPIRHAESLGSHASSERGMVARYELATPAGPVFLFSLHLDSPRQAIYETVHRQEDAPAKVEGNIGRRWRQSRYIAGQAGECPGPVLLVGDYNTPPESAIFREVWGSYRDAFTEVGSGWGYTFAGGRTRVRIDHVLLGRGWQCRQCWVGPSVGSPHLPVLADLVLEDRSQLEADR